MSDFDNIKVGDWVRVAAHHPASGSRERYVVHYSGDVGKTPGDDGWLHFVEGGAVQVTKPPLYAVELVEHRPVRGVGWHEVARPRGDMAVRWWDGDEWRHGPTGPRSLQYGRSEYYLGTGSSR